jgi:hypothetical protein
MLPIRGTIEQRKYERIVSQLQIKFYVIDGAYAQQLRTEAAYKDTHLDKLSASLRPSTALTGVTENISQGGLSLVSDQPLAIGTMVICDITVPSLPRPLRALAEVAHSDSKDGRIVDRTVSIYKSGLKIIAINKDDLTRIENYIIDEKIRQRQGGK